MTDRTDVTPGVVDHTDAVPAPDADRPDVTGDLAASRDDGEPAEALPAGGTDLADTSGDERRRRRFRLGVDVVVVAACVVFVLLQLQPGLLVRDTTPAGGDMGAHVWGPAYLRDHLLSRGAIAGWTHDWYAGFPAYQFYMVVPSLLIVLLDVGVGGWGGALLALVGVGSAVLALLRRHDRRTRWLATAGAVVALTCVGLPYGVAFKWVSVSGLLTLPVAAYLFGRLAGVRFPGAAVLAVATLPFLFYRGFNIFGGNVPSTLAGEFAFSISLSLTLVYLGVVLRGLETGRHRGLAAVLLALVGLCHLIPAFFALGATAVAVLVRFRRSRTPWVPGAGLVLVGLGTAAIGWAAGGSEEIVGLVLAGAGLLLVAGGLWLLSQAVRWLTPVLVVGGLLSAFWVLPFYLRRAFVNDMGWEKLPYRHQGETLMTYLLPHATPDVDLRWVFALALLGAVLSIALRIRTGIYLLLVTLGMGVAFIVVPEGRLWNGRLLPFYYLTAMLLAGLAVTEVARLVGEIVRGSRRAHWAAGGPVAAGALVVTLVIVGLPLGALPASHDDGDRYVWPPFGPVQLTGEPKSFITGWAKWNYSGYEGKDAYGEYHDVVQTMARVGEEHGCGRAFWEYEKELDRYGTPMALMLLPYWTDGCIGSMEGLFFEASSTTPFHFLVQVELSTHPSAAQRNLPYGQFDINRGVQHLQLMGVRYYMATSDNAINAARRHPDLTEIATSGPWAVFEVADSDLVEGLTHEPAVVTGLRHDITSWIQEPRDESGRFAGPPVQWFLDPERWDVALANAGPREWQRVDDHREAVRRPVEPVRVSDLVVEDDRISFDVDEVGRPVLVKVSYFPNWRAHGAEGPWRVAPNFMVVVPTDRHVELRYGSTSVEWLAITLTVVGGVGLVLLVRRGSYRFRSPRPVRAAAPDAGPGADAHAAHHSRQLDAVPPDDGDLPPRP